MTDEPKDKPYYKPVNLPIIKNIMPGSLFADMTDEDWKASSAASVRMLQEVMGMVRGLAPSKVADDIISIDPEGANAAGAAVKALFDNAKSTDELILDGYKQVGCTGLLWEKNSK